MRGYRPSIVVAVLNDVSADLLSSQEQNDWFLFLGSEHTIIAILWFSISDSQDLIYDSLQLVYYCCDFAYYYFSGGSAVL